MKMVFRLIVLAAVVAIAAWLWTVLFPSPEKIIRHRLDKIARDVSFEAKENPLLIASKAETLASFFSTNVEVNLDALERGRHDFTGRQEIIQAAAGAHSAMSALNVKFLDVNVTVGADKQSAVANLTVEARVADQTDPIVQPMKFTFRKTDGDWLVTRVEAVRPLT